MSRVGSGRAAPQDGKVTVGARDTGIAGRHVGSGVGRTGATHTDKRPRSAQDITVGMTDPSPLVVYVVFAPTP